MGSLLYFNFDIIIVIVLCFFAAYSFYCGLFRTLRLFFQFTLSFVMIELINTQLLNSNEFHKFNQKTFSFFLKLDNFIRIENKNMFSLTLIYFLIMLIVFFIMHLVFTFFKPSSEDLIIKSPKLYSRLISTFLGIFNTYFFLVLLIFSINTFVPLNNKGLTGALINNPLKLSSVEKYNEFNLELELCYNEYSYLIDLINGQRLEYEVNKFLLIQEKIYEIDYFVEDIIIPSLKSQDSTVYIEDNLPESQLNIKGYTYSLVSKINGDLIYDLIISKEITNSNLEIIKSQYDFLTEHKEHVQAIFELNQELDDLSVEEIIFLLAGLPLKDGKLHHLIKSSKFYLDTSEWFLNSEAVQDSISLGKYNQAINKILTNNDKIINIANLFIDEYENGSLFTSVELLNEYNQIYLLFKYIIKNKDIIFSFEESIPLDLKLVMIRVGFISQNKNLFNYPFSWAILNDTYSRKHLSLLSNDDSIYYRIEFASKYIFAFNLIDSYNYSSPIDGSMIEIILKRYEKMIHDNKIKNIDFASGVFDYLIINHTNNALFFRLYKLGLINNEAIEAILNSEYDFITSNAKTYLIENYLSN